MNRIKTEHFRQFTNINYFRIIKHLNCQCMLCLNIVVVCSNKTVIYLSISLLANFKSSFKFPLFFDSIEKWFLVNLQVKWGGPWQHKKKNITCSICILIQIIYSFESKLKNKIKNEIQYFRKKANKIVYFYGILWKFDCISERDQTLIQQNIFIIIMNIFKCWEYWEKELE